MYFTSQARELTTLGALEDPLPHDSRPRTQLALSSDYPHWGTSIAEPIYEPAVPERDAKRANISVAMRRACSGCKLGEKLAKVE